MRRTGSGLRPVLGRLLFVAMVGLVATAGWSTQAAAQTSSEMLPWIVEPARAAEIIDEADPVVFDTRSQNLFDAQHVAGAVPIAWEAFTPCIKEDRGELFDDEATLQKTLRGLGVDQGRPVLVVGNPPDNWGEDGRIVWMLRRLGHQQAALVDGGYRALVEQGVETTDEAIEPEEGDFEVDRQTNWGVERGQLRKLVDEKSSKVVVVDTRSKREYRGETPYGEDRAGHLPGAVHLHYKELLDEEGRLRPDSEIREILKKRGITADKRVIAYCTGGVRSAWLTVVLVHLGYDRAANYAGSAWDWAAAPAENYPLVTD